MPAVPGTQQARSLPGSERHLAPGGRGVLRSQGASCRCRPSRPRATVPSLASQSLWLLLLLGEYSEGSGPDTFCEEVKAGLPIGNV